MADIIFYEKPKCIGNARQKALLRASGHALEVRSLLAEPWTEETLLPFLRDVPVAFWFNQSAPDVKSGAIDPKALSQGDALALLIASPMLIRRPLMQVGEMRFVGFEADVLARHFDLVTPTTDVSEGCPRTERAV